MAAISSPSLKGPLPCQSSGKLNTGLFCHPNAASRLLTAAATTITTTADSLSYTRSIFYHTHQLNAYMYNTRIRANATSLCGCADKYTFTFILKACAATGNVKQGQQRSDMKPDDCTLVNVLSACSHGGLLNEGREMFHAMVSDYEIQPAIEHYGCMVDLLGRFGFLNESEELVREIPAEDAPAIWESLLSACRNHNHVELAKSIATKLLESKPQEVRRKMRNQG
nr:Pentatricopeptide repeat-containing protein [Ipomoea trifida]